MTSVKSENRISRAARPLRFGLRTLMILVALFGVGFGYLGHLYRRIHHQGQIVAKIQEAGGEVRYGWQIFGKSDVGSRPKPPGPALLRWIFGDDIFAYVESVDFNRFSHPTEPLNPKVLDELPRLRTVMLVRPQVNDEWVKCVSNISQLRNLVLRGSPQSTPITDAGLAAIARSTQLESLTIDLTGITDDGLLQLRPLTNLQFLSVCPDITKKAAQDLQPFLPHCDIYGEDKDGSYLLRPR